MMPESPAEKPRQPPTIGTARPAKGRAVFLFSTLFFCIPPSMPATCCTWPPYDDTCHSGKSLHDVTVMEENRPYKDKDATSQKGAKRGKDRSEQGVCNIPDCRFRRLLERLEVLRYWGEKAIASHKGLPWSEITQNKSISGCADVFGHFQGVFPPEKQKHRTSLG